MNINPVLRWGFLISSIIFAVWYAVGLVLLATDWLPRELVEASKVWGDIVFLLLSAAVTFLYSARLCGLRITMKIAGVILFIAACAETLGAMTGFPFGQYQYTDNLGPRLWGGMPWIIPFCWLTIVLNSFWIAFYLFQKNGLSDPSSRFLLFLATALLAVLTDLNLEPVASMVKHYWIWLEPGISYYEISGFNFFGWSMVTIAMVIIYFPSLPEKFQIPDIPWPSYFILAAINLLFALINYHAGFFIPVFIALNAFGGLGILLFMKDKRMKTKA